MLNPVTGILIGSTIESITFQFGLHQLINEPSHLLQNSSSCTDLTFTSQQNIEVESGVHPSSHPHCHHQIIFVKSNLISITHLHI